MSCGPDTVGMAFVVGVLVGVAASLLALWVEHKLLGGDE